MEPFPLFRIWVTPYSTSHPGGRANFRCTLPTSHPSYSYSQTLLLPFGPYRSPILIRLPASKPDCLSISRTNPESPAAIIPLLLYDKPFCQLPIPLAPRLGLVCKEFSPFLHHLHGIMYHPAVITISTISAIPAIITCIGPPGLARH